MVGELEETGSDQTVNWSLTSIYIYIIERLDLRYNRLIDEGREKEGERKSLVLRTCNNDDLSVGKLAKYSLEMPINCSF